jgi:hypothetical protein
LRRAERDLSQDVGSQFLACALLPGPFSIGDRGQWEAGGDRRACCLRNRAVRLWIILASAGRLVAEAIRRLRRSPPARA